MDLRRTTKNERQVTSDERRTKGSAIILAIVLMTLLAIVGVLFLFSSRVDSVATSAVGNNEDLKLAVDTVLDQISKNLTNNVPGVAPDPCLPLLFPAYYDYPDPCTDYWLACLEPYYKADTNDYRWRHVTDLYNNFGLSASYIIASIIPEYQPTVTFNTPADADGDGVSDSIWVPIQDNGLAMTSSKGKTIYAAVRIIDNGGMLNVNTGFKFNPLTSVGSSQLDINLMALAALDNTHDTYIGETQDRLVSYRCGTANANFYEPNVVWRYDSNFGPYTPFDISDELNLRNRYILNRSRTTRTISRIETLWTNAFDGPPYVPRDTSVAGSNWSWIVSNNYPAPCLDPCTYDNRHIATTYNCDRIINPAGKKMLNINNPALTASDICDVVKTALLEAGTPNADWFAAQIAVNLIDNIDTDPNVTTLSDATGAIHYGFESPCIYISQIAHSFFNNGAGVDGNSYAIELYKPYPIDRVPDLNNHWRLEIRNNAGVTKYTIPILWSRNSSFFVTADINVNASLVIDNTDANVMLDDIFTFNSGDRILLERDVNVGGSFIFTPVDWVDIPPIDAVTGWLTHVVSPVQSPHSIKRDISLHKCIRRLWESPSSGTLLPPDLGSIVNRYVALTDPYMIQAHPANKPFTNIGEISQIFRVDAYPIDANRPLEREYDYIDTSVSPAVFREGLRIDINMPAFQNLFKYLTVMDPNINNPLETRIKGRININTAPWFVLAQLPWMSYHTPNYELARSIVNYRDTIHGPFKNIGELMDVNTVAKDINGMWYYVGQSATVPIPPVLLTPTDGVGDEFEERDVIFDRISNLITVRSDVFTAYILVRIGPNGPQKRVIAILDRSNIVPNPAYDPVTNPIPYLGKVKILAVQSVPDPR